VWTYSLLYPWMIIRNWLSGCDKYEKIEEDWSHFWKRQMILKKQNELKRERILALEKR